VRNGTRVHYVVTALDGAGNASARSAEADALPRLTVADARLEGPAEVSQPLSAVEAGTPIHAVVAVDGVTVAAGPTVGIRAQLGFGAARGEVPADDYAWSDMTFTGDADGADRLAGSVRPEELGTYNVVLRVSTDDGATWSYADRGGIVTTGDVPWVYRPGEAVTLAAVAPAEADPPPAPTALRIATVAASSLTLAWEPVTAPDLYRYEVLRGTTAGGPYASIGTAQEPSFTDDTVSTGAAYVYVVTAVDTSFNRSTYSQEVAAAAETRAVAVTFVVTVPPNTPAADTLYIAGDFQGWDPGATPMARVDDRTWSITLPFTEGDAPQYKFTRGSWEAVEKDAACGEIPNRTVSVTYGTEGAQEVPGTVETWRDVNQCG